MKAALYGIVVALGLGSLSYWLLATAGPALTARVPNPKNKPRAGRDEVGPNANRGTLIRGRGTPSEDTGSWPQFRGASRSNVAAGVGVAPRPGSAWPTELWRVGLGEGYAGAAIHMGRIYVLDYDEVKKEDAVRCLSLDDGEEIWRFTYYVKVKRNHGMSRTVPAVTDDHVVTLGPKCHVVCLDAKTGELVWKKDLVTEYGAKVPEWYAGQCPLVDGANVILAPGGKCLMTAVALATGEAIWETPNPDGWKMTHASVAPVEFEGKRQYVWCAEEAAVGVDAGTGTLLWTLPEWRVPTATVPTPVDLGGGRLFLTGGYGAGGMIVGLRREGGRVVPRVLLRTRPEVFASNQQTPVLFDGLLYGVIPGGQLACMTPAGKRLWVDERHNFGLGPYMIADGRLLVLDDKPPVLYMFEVDSTGARELWGRRVLDGREPWAPMAAAAGRLILRDSKTMVCLDLR